LSTETLETSALARYTAQFWGSHLQNTEDKIEGSVPAMTLMSVDNPVYLNWIRLYDPEKPWKDLDLRKGLESVAMPLYYAGLLGLSTVTRLLLDKGANVNVQGECYSNALQAASARGHEAVVKTLLDQGADVNAQGGEYGNALQAASLERHEQIVKTLLDAGAHHQEDNLASRPE
jgi:hypothetical protein